MKLTTMFTVSAMAFAAVAQDNAATAPVAKAPEARAPREMMNRPMMNRPMMNRGMMDVGRDPVVQFATTPFAAKTIGLTDEQQAKIKEINKATREKMKALQKQQRAAAEKQHTLVTSEKPDEAAIMKAIDETFEIRKSLVKEQIKCTLALRAVLTPEQLAKASEEMNAMRTRGRKPRGPKAESKPVEAKPAEAKPAEAKPAEKAAEPAKK